MSSELLSTLAAYVPPSLIQAALDNKLPLLQTGPSVERFLGAVFFADISGFTPLTEALAQKGAEGPEELTRLLNRYFTWMIAFVEAYGGEVVKFGGDALMVVFPAQDELVGRAVRRAKQAAEMIQSTMEEFRIMESSVGIVTLKMKMSIGVGEILSARVGGVDNRWEYLIAGDPLRQVAQVEHGSGQNEIVLSPEAAAVIVPDAVPRRSLTRFNWSSVQDPTTLESILRCYIPNPVRTWLNHGLHSWLASLRPMSVLFVKVIGLDYKQPTAIDSLHAFICEVQKCLDHYEGSLVRLTVDDKGTVLLILFGAPPYSHEDDSERALLCALDLQTLAEAQGLALAIGVTTGRVFAGPVGSNTRREYTVMGDTVNLAARLMVMTKPGQISCSYETYRSSYGRMSFDALPPIEIKGKTDPISVFSPRRETPNPAQQPDDIPDKFAGPLVGRQNEFKRLIQNLDKVQAGHPGIVILEGEVGIGKSRLVHALLQVIEQQNLTVFRGIGRSIASETPYLAWQDIALSYFKINLADLTDPQKRDEAQARIQAVLLQIGPELKSWLPVLNDILPLELPETENTHALSELRFEKLCQLLMALFRLRMRQGKPVILIIDDAQWLDPLSWKLALQVAAAAIREPLPLLLVLVMRPLEGIVRRTEATLLANLQETDYLRLDTLSPEETLELVASQLGVTSHELPELVSELITRRASGNPYFAEELLHTLWHNNLIVLKSVENKPRCLTHGDWSRATQILPATVHSIILARIDQLPPEKQLLLKIAAVIGPLFAYDILRDTLNRYMEIEDQALKLSLDDLTYLDLIRPEGAGPHPTYSFKHIIFWEVTYQSLLFDRRRQLHRTVAQWYEQQGQLELTNNGLAPALTLGEKGETYAPFTPIPTSPTAYYSLLVYHWHRANDEAKELHYASHLGEQAAAQFANAEALSYLNRALSLVPPADQHRYYKLLLAREAVYDRYGDREKQAQDLATLASLEVEPENRALIALLQARYAEATGDYATAIEATQRVLTLAASGSGTALQEAAYVVWAKALICQGDYETVPALLDQGLTLARLNRHQAIEAELLLLFAFLTWLQGKYLQAHTYTEQALELIQAEADSRLKAHYFNMLGLICYRLADYSTAQTYFEQALAIYYLLGDKRGEIRTFYNIGLIYLSQSELETARDYFEQTLDIAAEIGDRGTMADTLSHLGLVYCKLGDYTSARGYLGQSLDLLREIGDRMGEADVFSKFGYVYYCLGNYKTAQRYCDMALAIQTEHNNRLGRSYSLTCLGHILADQGQLENAVTAYEAVIYLYKEMDRVYPALDALAGLARISLMRQELNQAISYTEEILVWLEAHGTGGTIDPSWIYLAAYQVLAAQPSLQFRAQAVLAAACTTLQSHAAKLHNKVVRRNFLNNIKTHRELLSLGETNSAPPPAQVGSSAL